MLINNPEQVLGSWGLINADPSTGDPNETEMDTILILTKDSYFVADYDDQVTTSHFDLKDCVFEGQIVLGGQSYQIPKSSLERSDSLGMWHCGKRVVLVQEHQRALLCKIEL